MCYFMLKNETIWISFRSHLIVANYYSLSHTLYGYLSAHSNNKLKHKNCSFFHHTFDPLYSINEILNYPLIYLLTRCAT